MRHLYGIGVLLLLVAVLPRLALGQAFNAPPKPDHYVTDNANALSSTTRSSVENELHAYEQSTGHQVIVWIGDTTGDVPLEQFTGDTARAWKVGRKGHDDGAILFLFMKDHKVRIEVGYGLEGSLTDADSHGIIQDVIVPRMRGGNVDDAVSGGVAAILKTITPAYSAVSAPPTESEGNTSPAVTAFILGIFAIFGVVIIFVIITIILRIIYAARYGYLILREGSKKAKSDMKSSAFWSGAAGGLISSSSFGGGDSGGDFSGGFDAGGGDFGGGGASGSW